MRKNLSQINTGVPAIVKSIEKNEFGLRLLEMGFTVGQSIEVLFKAPFGDPIAVQIHDYTLSMRLEEAKSVEVEI